jgi:N-acyl-D-amino-acid deacylase
MFKGSVQVEGDQIFEVTRSRTESRGEEIDVSGLFVCPGFIDMHSHSDLTLLKNPNAESKIHQGVTAEVVGNCGMSMAPIEEENKAELVKYVTSLLGVEDLHLTWRNFDEYLSCIEESGSAVNVIPLVGHGTIRIAVMGFDDRAPSSKELERMKTMIKESMRAGAFGMSSGLIYPPGCFADIEELVELCKPVSTLKGIYSTHIRGEGETLVSAVKEAIETGRRAKISVEISHHKAAGRQFWGQVKTTLKMIDQARQEGIDVSCDQYPYPAAWTKLSAVLPDWVKVGGVDSLVERLKDADVRKRLTKEIEEGIPGWSNHVKACGWDGIMISQAKYDTSLEGKTVAQIARDRAKNPYDVLFDILVEEETAVRAIYFMMSEDDVITVMKHPNTMIGTDGIALTPHGELGRGKPHPRFYGTFPRLLGRYVREKGVLSIEEAVRKMTSLPAEKLGLDSRGRIEPGNNADLVVFNYDKIIDKATYQAPHQFPQGIVHVIVNGEFVIRDGKGTGHLPGQVLRKTV